jgi:sugar lactone lactonase YvrE
MCKADRELNPVTKDHSRVTKLWETPAEFKIPESVLYDPKREILYVSSFSRIGQGSANTGFISKLTLDGRIDELKWIDELDGPCGMGIYEDRLYVVECSGNLVEIDIDAGKIAKRVPVPGAEFLNDLAIDRAGTIYMSNSSRVPAATDIHRFRAGKCEVWKDGTDLHRANGLFVHDNRLIVGNTGDGCWKRVELDSGHVSDIACLGAGINDGIRVDSDGNYLLSHWEGQLYRVSPSGEVVELLDTMAAGLNCADFEFVRNRDLLVVPTFLGNNVVAYTLASP